MRYLLGTNRILFSIFILCFSAIGSEIPKCIGNIKSCCEGYIWNSKNNTCEVCMPGFNGINCTEKCPFPTYGKRCQMLCKCNKDQCDASTGCSSNFDGNTTSSIVTHGSNILNGNSTSFPRKLTLSHYTNSSTENKIIFVFITITGVVGATLVFVNIIVCVYTHWERKRSVSFNQTCLKITL